MLELSLYVLLLAVTILSLLLYNKSKKIRHLKNRIIQYSYGAEQINQNTPFSQRSLIIFLDLDGNIKSINHFSLELFGYEYDEIIRKNFCDKFFPNNQIRRDEINSTISSLKENPLLVVEKEYEHTNNENKSLLISWTIISTQGKDGEAIGVCLIGNDISIKKELEYQLHIINTRDPLTGVLNRKEILNIGAEEIKRAKRYNSPLSIIAIELEEYLTHLNRNYSHYLADKLLTQIAEICSNAIDTPHFVGRIGSVKFVIVLSNVEVEKAISYATEIKNRIGKLSKAQGIQKAEDLTYFAISSRQPRDEDINMLMDKTDKALGKAKRAKSHNVENANYGAPSINKAKEGESSTHTADAKSNDKYDWHRG